MTAKTLRRRRPPQKLMDGETSKPSRDRSAWHRYVRKCARTLGGVYRDALRDDWRPGPEADDLTPLVQRLGLVPVQSPG